MSRGHSIWIGMSVLLLIVGVSGCSKRLDELRSRYPVDGGRYTILDEAVWSALPPETIEGLNVSEIKALMGEPAETETYYERKTDKRFFPANTVLVRSDDWAYISNNGSKRITVKFENKIVTTVTITDQ